MLIKIANRKRLTGAKASESLENGVFSSICEITKMCSAALENRDSKGRCEPGICLSGGFFSSLPVCLEAPLVPCLSVWTYFSSLPLSVWISFSSLSVYLDFLQSPASVCLEAPSVPCLPICLETPSVPCLSVCL